MNFEVFLILKHFRNSQRLMLQHKICTLPFQPQYHHFWHNDKWREWFSIVNNWPSGYYREKDRNLLATVLKRGNHRLLGISSWWWEGNW